MSNPIQKALGAINDHLEQMDAGFTIGATVAVPVDLTIGPLHHPTHLDVEIRENEVEIIDRSDQLERIEREIRSRIEQSDLTDG